MEPGAQAVAESKKALWTGRILSVLVVLFLLFNGGFSLTGTKMVQEGIAHMGYPPNSNILIGIALLTCTLVYAIPRTAVFGAILLTAYLGGATASHIRIGEPFYLPVIMGILVWSGIFLRERRLRGLVPFRSQV